jgi:hypothetical protein
MGALRVERTSRRRTTWMRGVQKRGKRRGSRMGKIP